MTPERWKQIGAVFDEVEAAPEPDRAALLERLCADDADLHAEVEKLLSTQSATATFIQDAISRQAASFREQSVRASQEQFGHYRVTGRIAQGGMGAVYEAVRVDDFHKKVALKIIKQEFDSDFARARFQQERQVLATLEHPYIARLIDGGESEDGSPYLVLEYVEGVPLSEYAEKLNRNERLALFLKICEAVDHAHRNLVIHRDLKPSNILVTATGDPKLLDFGIAKLMDPTSSKTQTGYISLTPDYASPEQVRGLPISTASDVYSLGVLLYQLLTDRKPYTIETGTPAEMDRVICTEQPPSPGIGNELDNIILMALRKEPERRYSSVSQFAEDIHRFLDQRPVSARPDTIGYRAGKFVRRNKLSLAAAVLIVIAIAGGTTAALLQARRAQRRFDQVRQLANTSLFEFDESIRDIPGTTASRELIVRTALRYLDSLSAEAGRDLDLKLELAGAYQRVGDVQGSPSMPSLGHEADALESYGKSQKLLEEIVRARPKDAKALRTLVETMLKAGDLEAVSSRKPQAKQSFETAQRFAAQARAAGANDTTLEFLGAGASLRLGDLLMSTGLSQARAAYQDALKGYTRANDLQASDRFLNAVAVTLTRLGRIDVFSGNPAGGTESFKKTLAIREDLARRNPASQAYQRFLALTLTDLGDAQGLPVYFNLGDPSGAEQSYLKAQAIQERLAKADPKSVLAKTDLIFLLNRLGAVLLEREPERAKEPLSRVMVLADQLSETSHRQDVQRAVGGAHQRLAAIALAQHRIADGIAEVRTAMEILGANHAEKSEYLPAGRLLGDLQLASGQPAAAKKTWEDALATVGKLDSPDQDLSDIRDAAELSERIASVSTPSCDWMQKALTLWQECKRRNAPPRYYEPRITKLTAALATCH